MSAPPDIISELLHSMQSCISDVKAWATADMLKLNDNKTELMLVTSKRTKHLHSLSTSITMGNAQIPLKKSVKNLGFILDCHLTMNAHVSNIARTCNFELRRLASIHRFLTSTATATLVSAFVLSRIDYCSSLLFGSTHGTNKGGLMLNSDFSLAAPQGGREPSHIKPVWCPRAGGSRQTGSPAGHCSHPLSRSSQTLLCHRISLWMVKLVGWGLCTPFSL